VKLGWEDMVRECAFEEKQVLGPGLSGLDIE
jgi:hypothetical protein